MVLTGFIETSDQPTVCTNKKPTGKSSSSLSLDPANKNRLDL